MTGALTFVGVVRDGVAGVDGLNSATSVALSPDGANVYATSYYLDTGSPCSLATRRPASCRSSKLTRTVLEESSASLLRPR